MDVIVVGVPIIECTADKCDNEVVRLDPVVDLRWTIHLDGDDGVGCRNASDVGIAIDDRLKTTKTIQTTYSSEINCRCCVAIIRTF